MSTQGLEIWAGPMFLWAGSIGETARRIEDLGFDGMGFADTQIIYYDPYVAMGVAARATSRLRLRTMVSTPVTRHPSVMAAAIATVQQESAGRAVLGLGRGDSAATLIGEPAFTGDLFERYIVQVQGYLRGEEVVLDNGTRSRSDWIGRDPTCPRFRLTSPLPDHESLRWRARRRGRIVFGRRRARADGVGDQLRTPSPRSRRDWIHPACGLAHSSRSSSIRTRLMRAALSEDRSRRSPGSRRWLPARRKGSLRRRTAPS